MSKKIRTAIIAALIILPSPLLITACGETSTPTPTQSSVSKEEIKAKKEQALTVAQKNLDMIANQLNISRPTQVGNTTIVMPLSWEQTVVPGSTVAFNITTLPEQNQSLGVTQISTQQVEINDEFLNQVVDGIKTANPNLQTVTSSVTTVSPSQGLLTIIQGGATYQGWVISKTSGTYLFTLGPKYTPDTPGVQPTNTLSTKPTIKVEGTPGEQVQAVINQWLKTNN